MLPGEDLDLTARNAPTEAKTTMGAPTTLPLAHAPPASGKTAVMRGSCASRWLCFTHGPQDAAVRVFGPHCTGCPPRVLYGATQRTSVKMCSQ